MTDSNALLDAARAQDAAELVRAEKRARATNNRELLEAVWRCITEHEGGEPALASDWQAVQGVV